MPKRAAPLIRRFERKVRGAVGSLSWLIYRINDPVMRDMFMAPSNRFRMREGLVSMLAGDVHRNPYLRPPVLAFKACYYLLRGLRRLGVLAPVAVLGHAAHEQGVLLAPVHGVLEDALAAAVDAAARAAARGVVHAGGQHGGVDGVRPARVRLHRCNRHLSVTVVRYLPSPGCVACRALVL